MNTTHQARIYLSYTTYGEPWVMTYPGPSGETLRRTFATRELAYQYASDNGII